MRKLALLLVLTLTGCAGMGGAAKVDVITFDRGAFGLTYGKLSQMLAVKCQMNQLPAIDCARLAEVDAVVTKQIMTPPAAAPNGGSVDMDALMRMLMGAAKLAM